MASSSSALVLPGDSIGQDVESTPGPGTHMFASHVHASRSGVLDAHKHGRSAKPATLSIVHAHGGAVLPEVNNTVLSRIIRLSPRVATCSILAIYPSSSSSANVAATPGSLSLPAPPKDIAPVAVPAQSQFSGQIRAQDVRATEKDKVVIGEAFRIGDIVRAVVISLGDQRDYYLSTAGNEYGVLLAWSASNDGLPGGELMEPISWQEMRDPVTGQKETRKVAKPI